MRLQTRLLMTISALVMGVAGIAALFAPQELLSLVGLQPAGLPVLVLQIVAAHYLGFAFVNWMLRGFLIGGIYARPIVLGNFVHFSIGAYLLVESLFAVATPGLLLATAIYGLLGLWFGLVLFSPAPSDTA